jgi:hypothetical protein
MRVSTPESRAGRNVDSADTRAGPRLCVAVQQKSYDTDPLRARPISGDTVALLEIAGVDVGVGDVGDQCVGVG